MVDRLRVYVEGIEDVGRPEYRMGDHVREVKHMLSDEDQLKDLVLEIGCGELFEASKPFSAPAHGDVLLRQVLFVRQPPQGKPLIFRVVKPHTFHKPALVGEGTLLAWEGQHQVELWRGEKARGTVRVEISAGIAKGMGKGGGLAVATPTTAGRGAGVAGGFSSPADLGEAATSHMMSTALTSSLRSVQSDRTVVPVASSPLGAAASSPQQSALAQREAAGGLLVDSCQYCFDAVLTLIEALVFGSGHSFLKKKQADPNFKTLPSGLLYKVLRRGHGRFHPSPRCVCSCNYTGRLIDGTVFDTTEGDAPARFCPESVIKGWTEALMLMVEGDMVELVVPPELAYGGAAVGPIPANSVLQFKLELVKITRASGVSHDNVALRREAIMSL